MIVLFLTNTCSKIITFALLALAQLIPINVAWTFSGSGLAITS
jgi:hypothetical protein